MDRVRVRSVPVIPGPVPPGSEVEERQPVRDGDDAVAYTESTAGARTDGVPIRYPRPGCPGSVHTKALPRLTECSGDVTNLISSRLADTPRSVTPVLIKLGGSVCKPPDEVGTSFTF